MMEKIVGDFSTKVNMSGDEAKGICKLGKGQECCAFLVVSKEGFQCARMAASLSANIFNRLEKGTMMAKGEGGWKGCAWEGEV